MRTQAWPEKAKAAVCLTPDIESPHDACTLCSRKITSPEDSIMELRRL